MIGPTRAVRRSIRVFLFVRLAGRTCVRPGHDLAGKNVAMIALIILFIAAIWAGLQKRSLAAARSSRFRR
jgi:hypothetical protein